MKRDDIQRQTPKESATSDASSRGFVGFWRRVFSEFSEDECTQMAAALAYYAIFSIAPVLVIAIAIASFFFNPQDVQGAVQTQLRELLGPGGAEQVRTMIEGAQKSGSGTLATILSIVALLFGATGVVAQLQIALNKTWDVKVAPQASAVKTFLGKRLLSLALVLGIGLLLIALLLLTAAVSAFGDWFRQYLPQGFSQPLLMGTNVLVSFVIITLLFAAVYKFLPDAELRWSDVLLGAVATALLFVAGKFLISLYLGSRSVGSAYGAAGSLVLVLLWIYYSSIIFLFGAELTQVWARRRGQSIRPAEGAVATE